MAKFLIEVPHGADKVSCLRAIQSFLLSGSHFLANADWGCGDGEHKAWLMLEVPTREDALSVVPANYRSEARVVKVGRYALSDVEESLRYHEG